MRPCINRAAKDPSTASSCWSRALAQAERQTVWMGQGVKGDKQEGVVKQQMRFHYDFDWLPDVLLLDRCRGSHTGRGGGVQSGSSGGEAGLNSEVRSSHMLVCVVGVYHFVFGHWDLSLAEGHERRAKQLLGEMAISGRGL